MSKNFIKNGIISVISDYGDTGTTSKEGRITTQVAKEFVSNSKTLPNFLRKNVAMC